MGRKTGSYNYGPCDFFYYFCLFVYTNRISFTFYMHVLGTQLFKSCVKDFKLKRCFACLSSAFGYYPFAVGSCFCQFCCILTFHDMCL